MFAFIFQTSVCILTNLKWQPYFLESHLIQLIKSKYTGKSHSVMNRVSYQMNVSSKLLENTIFILERTMEFQRIS